MTKKTQTNNEVDSGQTQPIRKKEEVAKSNDDHIDQDFPGYPHQPASEDLINPKKSKDKGSADTKDKRTADTDRHNGAGGAFEATEQGYDEGDDDR